MTPIDRRALIAGAGFAAAMASDVFAQSTPRPKARAGRGAPREPDASARHRIRFAVIGLDHSHIYGMTDALIRGGGTLVAMHAADPAQIAPFRRRYGDVTVARSEAEILDDPTIQLVASASIPDLRAPLGIRVMRAGKDFLADKPGITSLKQLAAVREAVRETRRKFAILYSERSKCAQRSARASWSRRARSARCSRPSTLPRTG